MAPGSPRSIEGDLTAELPLPRGDAEAPAARSRRGARRPFLLGLGGPRGGELIPLRRPALLIGRAADAGLRLPCEQVSRRHAQLVFRGGAWWLEDLGSKNGTRLNRRRTRRAPLHEGDQIQIGSALLGFVCADFAEERFHRHLHTAALRDGLTRLFNKRYFGERLRSEVAYAARHLAPLSLLLVDVDHFKQVNDTHGHPAGDRALRAIAAALRRATRSEDVVARCGGEEFAVLCRGLRLPEARALGERVRRAVEGVELALPGAAVPGTLRLTVSLGAAELPPLGPRAADPDHLLASADRALYAAKAAGRNCVRVAAEDVS